MKFKGLHEKARLIDDLIDENRKASQASFVSKKRLVEIVSIVLPDAVLVSFGLHKLVFRLAHKTHLLALKVGKQLAIERDHRAYKMPPPNIRHVYFARIFWHTKYCLLQEYGVETKVSPGQLMQLRQVAYKYGLLDISCENIRSVAGNLKIIDANVSPHGLYRIWKTADVIMRRMPNPVRRLIRKSRSLIGVYEFKS